MKEAAKYRYVTYCLSDDMRQIKVCSTAPPSATYNDFVEELKVSESKQECRYAVFDVNNPLRGQDINSLLFFVWCPDSAKIRQKMIYTSSKDGLKKTLVGVGKEVQACDQTELAWTRVMDILTRAERLQKHRTQ